MSDDLRSRCIIAMRDVIGGYAYDHLGNPEYPFEGATAARLALDAMLDCLTENMREWIAEERQSKADAWSGATIEDVKPVTSVYVVHDLLAVLREDR